MGRRPTQRAKSSRPQTQERLSQQAAQGSGLEVVETREWLDSLDYVLTHGGPERAGRLLQQLALHARRAAGINLPFTATTPYQNTIPSRQQPPFPGSQEMERRIKSLVRWNAMAMVVRANKIQDGIGGHISTFASAATLYEVAFNHFFRAATESGDRDIIYFQGHAAPGIYARAFLEGRIPKAEAGEFPPRNEAGRRVVVVSASVADAGFLGIPYGLDGAGADSGHLSCAVHQVSGESRAEDVDRRKSLGVHGRRRNGRAGVARLDHAGVARAARQFDFRGELQSAAAGWASARQRENHSGTGSDFPRRGMERDQGHLGRRLGFADPERPRWPAGAPHGRNHRRAVSEIFRRERSIFPAELLWHRSAAAQDGRSSLG